jgi:membrane protein implicated in regulation of membrane protease activity
MSWPDIFLLCFAIGVLWSVVTLLLGGLHFGHFNGDTGHASAHIGHGHMGHAGHVHAGHMHAGHTHAPTTLKGIKVPSHKGSAGWIGSMLNPSSAAVFLAWFGGVGYVLTRHSGLALITDLALAGVIGLIGAWLLAAFLRFLQSREMPLDPFDYEMVGILGHVSCAIRKDGVGEVIYLRDGARRPLPARSADDTEIRRGEEVVVTRYEQGIAYVRTWEAITQPGKSISSPETLLRENKNVQ